MRPFRISGILEKNKLAQVQDVRDGEKERCGEQTDNLGPRSTDVVELHGSLI
jgi:hypothetical protein